MDHEDIKYSPDASKENGQIKPVKFEPYTSGKTEPSFSFNLNPLLIGVLLLFGVFSAWFMFTGKAVYIEIDPVETEINIDSVLKLKLADRYLIRPGGYDLRLSARGYYPIDETLTVGHEQTQNFQFKLEKLPGHLQVNTGAVAGAEVFVDGVSKGRTPVTIRDIPHGERLVTITAERYSPFEDTIDMEGLDKEQTINIDLTPTWAEVSFDSDPRQAEVFNGDELLGSTPLVSEMPEGRHHIRIKSSGYKAWQKEISVIANKPLSYNDIELEPADATLILISRPARANATINGNYAGLTPLEVALSPGEKTHIRLFKQGYKPAAESITAKSGEQRRVNITLKPELVSVLINAKPQDAKLYIDGKLIGPASRTMELPAKKHRIEIRKTGYVDYKTTLTPHIGIDQELKVSLKSVKQAKLESVEPLIKTAAGQRLKLFYPGSFTMGASRREPGRRANETIRHVKLTRPFYLGIKEVTNAEYNLFDPAFSSGLVDGNGLNGENQPVVRITWEQAARYCNWLSKQDSLAPFYMEKDGGITGMNEQANGYRLPTEAEWAWSARVTARGTLLKFPWGEQMPPTGKSGNFADEKKYDDGFVVSAPVGSFEPDGRGLYDMGGNVAEWVNDFYGIGIRSDKEVKFDPMGPATGEFRVIRGSSWAHGTITELRYSFRDYGNKIREDLGFRVARYLD